MVFNHSVKVPTQYKRTAAVLKSALENKKSLKSLIFEEKHAHMRGMQAVLKLYSDNRKAIDCIIIKTEILKDNPRLCPFLCKILVTELLFGRKQLNGKSRPVLTVIEYKDKLEEALESDPSVTANIQKKELKPRYVRINTNRVTIVEACEMLASEGWHKKEQPVFELYTEFIDAIKELKEDEFMFDMHIHDLLIFHGKNKYYWACHQYVKEKKLMLQDKGTCFVAELLSPPPGSVVLDMCAAPGMKTIQVCNIMKNNGTIYAVEQNEERHKLLCSMTTTAGCQIVKPIHADALAIDGQQYKSVEYVLVDPSCSGSGMQNRISLDSDEKNPERLRKLAGLQIKMLSHAMTAYPEVKRIIYSTCSFYEEENEQVVQRCLQMNPHYKLLSIKKALRNKWKNYGNANYKKIGKYVFYSRPDDDFTDGIFIALFEKRCAVADDD